MVKGGGFGGKERRLKRLREAEDGFLFVEASNNKGEGILRKICVKIKQSEPDASFEFWRKNGRGRRCCKTW